MLLRLKHNFMLVLPWTDFFHCSLDVHIKKGSKILLVILAFSSWTFHTYIYVLITSIPPFPPFQLLLTPFPSHPFSCSHPPPWVHLVLLVCMGVGPSAGLWGTCSGHISDENWLLSLPHSHQLLKFLSDGPDFMVPCPSLLGLAGLMLCRSWGTASVCFSRLPSITLFKMFSSKAPFHSQWHLYCFRKCKIG